MRKRVAGFPGEVPRMSVVTTVVRTDWAKAIADLTRRLAYYKGSPGNVVQRVQGALIHKVFHWMQRAGTHFLPQVATMERAARLAVRLLDREHRKASARLGSDHETTLRYPRGPIPTNTWIKLWEQLSFEEQRVMQLVKQGFSLDEIAIILDVTTHAAQFYRNRAHRKIHQAYVGLC